jgi:hypothetical protein
MERPIAATIRRARHRESTLLNIGMFLLKKIF